jgi:hypothetical protein
MGARLASFVVGAVLVAVAVPALAVVEGASGEEMTETATTPPAGSAGSGEEMSEEAATPPAGSLARAVFTSGIVDREPQDSLDTLTNDHVQVYFFTELRDMEGRTIVHRWMWNGEVMAEVAFDVAGPRWRVHSSKNLEPSWLGDWTVMVVDTDGNEIGESHFTYGAVETSEPTEVPASAAETSEPTEVPASAAETSEPTEVPANME